MNQINSPKGPLALLVHPVNNRDLAARTNDSTHMLHHFDYDPTGHRFSRLKNKRRRRKNRNAQQTQAQTSIEMGMDDAEGQQLHIEMEQKLYHPTNGEFTIAFFCEINCRHSQRVTLVLAKFMHALEKKQDDQCIRPVQLICIPNDDIQADMRMHLDTNMNTNLNTNIHVDGQASSKSNLKLMVGGDEANLFTHLYSHAEFWHMGFDHVNRSAIIAMLSVAVVPSLIVINNKTGRIVTSWGMEAMENTLDHEGGGCEKILDEWRENRSGVALSTKLMNACTIS